MDCGYNLSLPVMVSTPLCGKYKTNNKCSSLNAKEKLKTLGLFIKNDS